VRVRGAAIAVALVATACGVDDRAPATPAVAATSTPAHTVETTTPGPPPSPRPLPPPIDLAVLPHEGVIVHERGDLLFLDVTGNVVDRVRDMGFAGNGGGRAIWTRRGRDYFRFDEGGGRLVPVPRGVASDLIYGVEPKEPALRPPPGTRVPAARRVAGHWRYAYEGPAGVLLAQWSGECETPTAYWKEPGERPEIVTGGHDLSAAPDSFALGWSDDGMALVLLPQGGCGATAARPGIYRFTEPAAGSLLYETTGYAGARMWQ
jgi:hypothetical protein